MKPFLPSHSSSRRARPAITPAAPRIQPVSTMRSTVLLSLLLCPDGGAETHRHGQGDRSPRAN
jgi:hypothetical protein